MFRSYDLKVICLSEWYGGGREAFPFRVTVFFVRTLKYTYAIAHRLTLSSAASTTTDDAASTTTDDDAHVVPRFCRAVNGFRTAVVAHVVSWR